MKAKKIMGKFLILAIALYITSNIFTGTINAAERHKTATNTLNRYSWCGIWVYSLGVEGEYASNGYKITQYNGVDAIPKSGFMWFVKDGSSGSWAYKGTKDGTCKAVGTFCQSALTKIIQVPINTQTESVYANAYK